MYFRHKTACGPLGGSPEQCAAFGDGGNDIEMLNYCGYSFAMENALEK
jgi:hydroxymethylpyrimidine pyrophosphatase-like HAD family hydrolase